LHSFFGSCLDECGKKFAFFSAKSYMINHIRVIVSQDLRWKKQCSAVVHAANKVLGMIKQNFVDRSKDTILALFKSE